MIKCHYTTELKYMAKCFTADIISKLPYSPPLQDFGRQSQRIQQQNLTEKKLRWKTSESNRVRFLTLNVSCSSTSRRRFVLYAPRFPNSNRFPRHRDRSCEPPENTSHNSRNWTTYEKAQTSKDVLFTMRLHVMQCTAWPWKLRKLSIRPSVRLSNTWTVT